MKRHFFTPLLMAVLGLYTFQEVQAQTAICHENITKATPDFSCNVAINFSDIDNGSFDYDTWTLSQSNFIGPDTFQVTLTVMKNSGQSSTCTSNLYVVDKTKPVAVTISDLHIKFDSTNTAVITPEMINDGSYDQCSPISNMIVTPSEVDCNDVSPIQVYLTVYDESGNAKQGVTNVHLSNASNSTNTLACNDMVTVKLNPGESKKIYPYEILEGGPYKCWEEYSLDILENNIPFPDDVVRYWDVNKNLIVKITDNATQIACWGSLIVKAEICDALIICDTGSRCDSIGDCSSGHSLEDDVEWPCDVILIEVSPEVYQNPTPELLAEFTQKDLDEYIPILYNDNSLCSNDVTYNYEDAVFLDQPGKTIHRTWRVLHWQTNASYTYLQVIRLGESGGINCEICDSLAWDTPFNGCENGHSDLDAVEWPSHFSIDGKKFAVPDLLYEPGFEKNNAIPSIKEECRQLIVFLYNDDITYWSQDSLEVARHWKLIHKQSGNVYKYIQRITATNVPNTNVKVCVRRRNETPMDDILLFHDHLMNSGPCDEFLLEPQHTQLSPLKVSQDYVGGVDLSDLILMYEHILGIRKLNSIQTAAADFNGNAAVSTLDAVLLTRMIDGESVDLSAWPSPWKFAHQLTDFSFEQDLQNQIYVFPGSVQNYGYHFIGYKLGDINDSYENGTGFSAKVGFQDEILTQGEKYTIPVLATTNMKVKGLQCKIAKTDAASISNISSSLFPFHQWTEKEDYYSFLAFDRYQSTEIDIKAGDILFILEIEATKNDVLHNVLQFVQGDHQKIITDDYQSIPFDIQIDGLITVGTKNQNTVNIQVQPNPVYDLLTIQHDLDGPISVTVFSSTGQKMLVYETITNANLPVGELSPAMYLLQVRDQSGKIGYTTFIKN